MAAYVSLTLNGQPLHHVVEFDTREGWAVRYKRHPETGRFVVEDGRAVTERVYGKVEAWGGIAREMARVP